MKATTKLEAEKWLPVSEYEGIYIVSNRGNLKSLKSNKTLKPALVGGYCRLTLSKGGIRKNLLLHRIVACAFIENPMCNPQVNHINGIKTDNRIENLEWVTNRQNLDHSIRLGLTPNGQRSCNAKLEDIAVPIILEAYKKRIGTQQSMANYFGVALSTINGIVRGARWVRPREKYKHLIETTLPPKG